ncbi:N-6 DNA methylase [Bacteroides xylanisolvens]|uniref:N-6 DNA methylase n=1 Tax=Bacteroides xylanisolvens TaxID=371601 RepID=UPI00374F7835
MKKEELFNLFGIEDLKDLPGAIMNLLEGDIDVRNEAYKELIQLNNNDMSYDWFQEMYEAELSERKQKGQDFTCPEVSQILSDIIGQKGTTIHEPTAGCGGLLIADWWKRCSKKIPWEHFPSQNMVTCWELSVRSIPILLLNLSIRGMMGYVYHGDVLTKEVKQKYILLNRKDDTLAFSEIIKDTENKLTIKNEIHYDDSRDIR